MQTIKEVCEANNIKIHEMKGDSKLHKAMKEKIVNCCISCEEPLKEDEIGMEECFECYSDRND